MAQTDQPTSLETLKQKAEKLSADIHKKWNSLNSLIIRHELDIQNAWYAKNERNRKILLRSGWKRDILQKREDLIPELYTEFYDAMSELKLASEAREKATEEQIKETRNELKKKSKKVQAMRKRLKAELCFQMINLEDLIKDRPLLLMLKSRGRNHPRYFFGVDHHKIKIAKYWLLVEFESLEKNWAEPDFESSRDALMYYAEGETPLDYGRIEGVGNIRPDERDGYTSVEGLLHDAKNALEGLETLEMQDTLLEFLLECCKNLLKHKNLTESDLKDDRKCPVKPEPALESDPYSDLVTVVEEAPYKVPAGPDPDDWERLLAAKVTEAEDHMWELRAKPDYFKETLEVMKAHDLRECIRDKERNRSIARLQGPDQPTSIWHGLTHRLVCDGFESISRWENLRQDVIDVRDSRPRDLDNIQIGQSLPETYLTRLQQLYLNLESTFDDLGGDIHCDIASLDCIRKAYVRNDSNDTEYGRPWIEQKKNEGFPADSPFFKLVLYNGYLVDKDFLKNYYAHEVVQLVHGAIEDPKIMGAVTPYILKRLADLSLIAEIMRGMDEYYPWIPLIKSGLKKSDDGKIDDTSTKVDTAPRAASYECGDKITIVHGLAGYAYPLERFDYPTEEEPTKEGVDKRREAEGHLGRFWTLADVHSFLTGGAENHEMINNVFAYRPIPQTREWTNPQQVIENVRPQPGRPAEIPRAAEIPRPADPPQPPAQVAVEEIRVEHQDVIERAQRGGKRKRGEEARRPAKRIRTEPEEDKPRGRAKARSTKPDPRTKTPDQEAVHLDPRSFVVFCMLFNVPTQNGAPKTKSGELAWSEFTRAFAKLGFQIQSRGGSAYRLVPPKDKKYLEKLMGLNAHEITDHSVHRPHPGNSWRSSVARSIGDRLAHKYWWRGRRWFLEGVEPPPPPPEQPAAQVENPRPR